MLLDVANQHDVSPSQVAIAWVQAQPAVTSSIIGARNLDQLEDNLAAVDLDLSDDELERLSEVSEPDEMYPYRFIRDLGAR